MDRRGLTLAALTLFVMGTVAAACGGKVGAGGGGAASIVPAIVPAFIALDTDTESSQWQTVDELASRFPDKVKAVDSLKQSLREDDGLDFDKDVKPALGPEVDIAWLDFDNGGEDVVGLVQPRDEAAFERLIAKGNAKDPEDKLYHAQVGDWQAFSDKQSVLDRFRQESSATGGKLADDETFKRAMDAVPGDSLVKAYVNGPSLLDAVNEYGDPSVSDLLARAGTLDWIVAGLQVSDDGVRFDTVVRGTPGELFNSAHVTQPYEAKLPSRVPSDALAYFTFHGAEGMLSGLTKTPQLSSPELRPLVKVLRDVESLLQGENALYVRGGSESSKYPEVTLVTEPKAGTDGAATVDGILRENSSSLGVEPSHTTIDGIPARAIDLGPVQLYYANVDGNLVVTDSGDGLRSFAHPSETLAGSSDFEQTAHASGLPSKTQGYLYVNVRGGVELAQKLSQTQIPDEVKRNLSPLRSVLEYTATRPSELQVTFFVRIA